MLETAILLPILFWMIGGFVALMLQVQAQQEIDTATTLATEATFQNDLGVGTGTCPATAGVTLFSSLANPAECATFSGTMQFYPHFFSHVIFLCAGNYLNGRSGSLTGNVTCNASGQVLISATPVSWAQFFGNPTVRAEATSQTPPIRQ